MNVIGSEYLIMLLHALAQGLLIPVLLSLLGMALYIVIDVGNFLAERQMRKRILSKNLLDAFWDGDNNRIWQDHNIHQVIEQGPLNARQKSSILQLIVRINLNRRQRKILARDLLDTEEMNYNKILRKTDLLSKLAPVIGLMGTLIPLGPGLAALGQGDIQGLAESVIIAFDTTVIGVCVGAVSAAISKVRRSWYHKDLQYMENVLELVEGRSAISHEEQEKKNVS